MGSSYPVKRFSSIHLFQPTGSRLSCGPKVRLLEQRVRPPQA
jgi:hypothetical protein